MAETYEEAFPVIEVDASAEVDVGLYGVGEDVRVGLWVTSEHYDSRSGLGYMSPNKARQIATQLLKAARWAEGDRT